MKRGALTHLRTILRTAAKSLGVERAAHAALAAEMWPDVVGPEAAAATRVDGLRGGTLLVSAQPGLWAQELSVRRSQLAASLNAALGERVILDIRITQRAFEPTRPAHSSARQVAAAESVGEEERAAIERAAAEIQDPELREITTRAMISQARWRQRQRPSR
ncbi:MAG: DUF721 domain-containing protein [bacterium]